MEDYDFKPFSVRFAFQIIRNMRFSKYKYLKTLQGTFITLPTANRIERRLGADFDSLSAEP